MEPCPCISDLQILAKHGLEWKPAFRDRKIHLVSIQVFTMLSRSCALRGSPEQWNLSEAEESNDSGTDRNGVHHYQRRPRDEKRWNTSAHMDVVITCQRRSISLTGDQAVRA